MFKFKRTITLIMLFAIVATTLGATVFGAGGVESEMQELQYVENSALTVAERSDFLDEVISNMCTQIPSMLGLTETVGRKSVTECEQRGTRHDWVVGFDAWIDIAKNIWELRIDDAYGFSYLYNPAAAYTIYSMWAQDEFGLLVEVDLVESARQLNNQLFEFAQFVKEIGCRCDEISLNAFLNEADINSSALARTFTYVEAGRSVSQWLSGIVVSNTVPGPHTFQTLSRGRVNESIPPNVTSQGNAAVTAVRNGAGFQWVQHAYTSAQPGGNLTIPAGQRGHIVASPYLNTTWGTLVIREGTMTHNISVQASSPQLVGSVARAWFRVVLV